MSGWHKIVEAVGLTLLLAAWGLSWKSVQHWQSVENTHRLEFESLNQAASRTATDIGIAYQGAATRATAGLALDQGEPRAALLAAWHSAEVRNLALARVVNNYAWIDQVIRSSIALADREDLALSLQIERLNRHREKVRQELLPAIDLDKGSLENQFPSEDEFSLEQAYRVDAAISVLMSDGIELLNQAASAIREKRISASKVYEVAYFLGALLIVVGKGSGLGDYPSVA